MNASNNLSQQDLEQLAKERGERLAFLLASLKIDEEQRQAWVTLLPEMSLDQLDRLLNILEAKYLDQQSQGPNTQLKQDLEKIKTEHQQKREDLNKTTLEKIKNLSDKLD